MAKVLIATEKPFSKAAADGIVKILEAKGHEAVKLEKYTDKADLIAAVKDAEALIVRSDKVTADVIEAAPNLKIVVRAGAGYDNVDCVAAKEQGVVVENTPGQNSNAVAELAFGLMLFKARNFFDGTSGKELFEKKLGIQGFGAVGRRMADIAHAFGMEVYAFGTPRTPDSVFEEHHAKRVYDAAELYETCDYISLNFPAKADTLKSVNYELLSRMPKNGVLVNTARAEVVDDAGLLEMFEKREDFVYLSDVAPSNKAEIVERFPGRFYFTPKKMGAQTGEANKNAGFAAAKQICAFFENGCTEFQVNK